MTTNQSFSSVYNKLLTDNSVQIHLGGSDIDVRITDHTQMSLTASVYEGGDFIPHSVRKCIRGKVPFQRCIPTSLIIEEHKYQVLLTYKDRVRQNSQSLRDLLEEFSWQADEWRLYLEEHDKHDLVYVSVR